MANEQKFLEMKGYLHQARANLQYYKDRRDGLIEQKESGKRYVSKDGADLLPKMIEAEDQAVRQYQAVVEQLEQNPVLKRTSLGMVFR